MKPKSYLFRALGKYKFSDRYFRFIFDIGFRKQSFLLAPRRLGRFFLLVKRTFQAGRNASGCFRRLWSRLL